eukprot:scaffold4810_cov112-Isochrysis_galbana.AAC.2
MLVQALDLVGVADSTNASPAEHAVVALCLSIRLLGLAEQCPALSSVLVVRSNVLRERLGVIGEPRGEGLDVADRFKPAHLSNEGRVYQPEDIGPGHPAGCPVAASPTAAKPDLPAYTRVLASRALPATSKKKTIQEEVCRLLGLPSAGKSMDAVVPLTVVLSLGMLVQAAAQDERMQSVNASCTMEFITSQPDKCRAASHACSDTGTAPAQRWSHPDGGGACGSDHPPRPLCVRRYFRIVHHHLLLSFWRLTPALRPHLRRPAVDSDLRSGLDGRRLFHPAAQLPLRPAAPPARRGRHHPARSRQRSSRRIHSCGRRKRDGLPASPVRRPGWVGFHDNGRARCAGPMAPCAISMGLEHSLASRPLGGGRGERAGRVLF